jgi:hypothetical protein
MFRAKKVEAPLPVVQVKLDESGMHWVYVKPCRVCGERHLHGAGGGLGYRLSHCHRGDPHTVLLVSDDEPGNAS